MKLYFTHRRSQGCKGAIPPKFLENVVILCFESRFSKQNSVILLKSNILPPPIFFPPQISGLATQLTLPGLDQCWLSVLLCSSVVQVL